MTEKVGEGRKCGRTDCDEQRAVGAYLCEKHAQGEGIVEGLVAKWRGEAEALAKIGQPGAEQIAEDYLRECATELEAALAKQTPAPREVGQAQAWGERIGRIEAFKEASRHKYSHGRIGSACACGVRFEGNADREWPAHIESLVAKQTPAGREIEANVTDAHDSPSESPVLSEPAHRSSKATGSVSIPEMCQQTPHAAGQAQNLDKITDAAIEEFFENYKGSEAKDFRHAARRNLKPILLKALGHVAGRNAKPTYSLGCATIYKVAKEGQMQHEHVDFIAASDLYQNAEVIAAVSERATAEGK